MVKNIFFSVVFVLGISSLLIAQAKPSDYDTDMLSAAFHAEKRQALRDKMDPNSVAVVFANAERNRSNDVDYQYSQDPNFYYLCGYTEPNAVLIIFKDK